MGSLLATQRSISESLTVGIYINGTVYAESTPYYLNFEARDNEDVRVELFLEDGNTFLSRVDIHFDLQTPVLVGF